MSSDAKTNTQTTKENNVTQLKNDNDIGYTEFMNKYSVYLADGTIVPASVKKRAPIFKELIYNQQLLDLGIVAFRKAGNHSYPVIHGEKLSDLQQITGYHIAPKEDNSYIPFKKDNDIGMKDFIQVYSVRQSDGNYISRAENGELFKILVQDQQLISLGIVAKRKNSTNHVHDYIIGDRLEDLQEIKGYHIAMHDDAAFIPIKKGKDINKNSFLLKYYIYSMRGGRVTYQVLDGFLENQELMKKGIIATRRNSKGTVEKYIINDKLQEFYKELLKSGYFVISKDKVSHIPAPKENDICCDISYRDREERKLYQDEYIDLYRESCTKGYQIYDNNGQVIEADNSRQIFNDFISNSKLLDSGVVVWKRFPWGYVQPVIDGDKLHELYQITGCQISRNETLTAPKENDIDFKTFNEAYTTYYFGTKLYGCKRKLFNEQDRNTAFNSILRDETLLDANIVVERRLPNGRVERYINGDKLKELKQESGLVICLTKKDYINELKEEHIELKDAFDRAEDQLKKSKFARQIKRNVQMMKFLNDGKEN